MVKIMFTKFHAKVIIYPGIISLPHPWGALKNPILNRVNNNQCYILIFLMIMIEIVIIQKRL